MNKKSNKKLWVLILLLIGSVLVATAYFKNDIKKGHLKDKVGDRSVAKMYVCSMHPQVIQTQPGDCPICGMTLIEKIVQPVIQKQKVYVCSMHPQIIQSQQGDCPICGMMLIEKAEKAENEVSGELNNIIRPANESVMASVQAVSPNQSERPLIIAASGIINFDSHKVTTISAKFAGLIEKSYIKFAYQPIHKGMKIYDIYCPEIYNDHWNYINIIKKFPDKPDLNLEARLWLEMLGLTKPQIEDVITSEKLNYHLSVYSDVTGYAVGANYSPEFNFSSESSGDLNSLKFSSTSANIGLNEGQIVETGTPLFKVLNTETVRADLKIRTEDMGLLQIGQNVILTDAVSPDRMYKATVSQIEPFNGGLFQLVKVYVSDHEKLLLPGRQIQALIQAGNHEALWVPKSSIINLGRKRLVFMLRDSSFVATNIKTGLQSGDQIEILSGLDKSSRIALNASLLTDSDGFIKSN